MLERLPRQLLLVEGLALLAGALVLCFHADHGWVLLVVLLLAPDLSLLGYLGGPAVGAVCHDAAHTTVLPIALGAVGVVSGSDTPRGSP